MNFSGVSNATLVGKALRLPLKLLPENAHVRILQGPLRGKRWIAGSSNHGCWLGSYEFGKQKAFSAAIQPGDVVYDLGANVGFYSLLASILVGPTGQVASFEPLPRNLHFLRSHLTLNEVTNCTVFDAAVSSSNGTAVFDIASHASMGHLTAAGPQAGTSLSVRTVKIDDIVAAEKLRPATIMKCDIEGAEYDALLGSRNLLENHIRTIFLATHGADVHKQCCKLLHSLKYDLVPLDGLALAETSEIMATRRRD